MEQRQRALCETDRVRLLKSPVLCCLPVLPVFLWSPWSQPAGSFPVRQPVRGAQTSLESRKYGARKMSFRTREIISPTNVRSSSRAYRNIRQPCPRPKSLNNVGLKGPARGAPRAWPWLHFCLAWLPWLSGLYVVLCLPVFTACCGGEDTPQGVCPVDVS